MATNFPTSVDVLTNPVSNDSLNSPSHSAQHANANDAIEAIEDYLLNGGQGLTFVNSLTWASGTTSASIDNVFSSKFNHYRLILNNQGGGTADSSFFRINFRASGSDLTGNHFGRFKHIFDDATSWGNNVLTTGNFSMFPVYTSSGSSVISSIDLTNPSSTASPKVFTGTGFRNLFITIGGGQWDTTTAADGFKITVASGTLGAGSVRIYGYK